MLAFWSLEPRRRAQTSVPDIELEDRGGELVSELAKMTDGRCAFCEADASLRVHRFRPPGNALPLGASSNAHLYYLWLADAWQNLYPICQGCIPPEPQFPVRSSRASLPSLRQVETYVERGTGVWPSYPPKEVISLLDPARDRRFEEHFTPKLDGELFGASRKGEMTIAVYNLNRGDRRLERGMAYQSRLDQLYKILDDDWSEPDWGGLFDFRRQEFGGTWYLLLRRIAQLITSRAGLGWQTTAAQLPNFFLRLHNQGNAGDRVREAAEILRREDPGLRDGRFAIGSVYSMRTPISTVEIENFKAIERLAIDFGTQDPGARADRRTARSLMILGENATGKSSILEAIALALMSDSARQKLEPDWPRMVLDASQLGLDRPGPRRSGLVRVGFASGQSVALSVEDGMPWVESELGNQQVPIFAYGAFRRFGRGTQGRATHQHVRNLFDANPISNPEPWLKKLRSGQFDMVIRTLRDLLSVEGEFDVIQREPSTRQLRMVTAIRDPNGDLRYSRTPLHALSSGYRSMLAMLCDVMRGLMDDKVYEGFESFETAEGIVLIDEIEAHLHPRWKVQVMSSLRAALPRMTFIVTTHDPLCLRGMGDDEVLVLHRIAASDSLAPSRLPIVVERMGNLPAISDLRVEQLLTSDFFQLLSTDDAAADRRLARIADLMGARSRDQLLSPEDQRILRDFERDIAAALPVGSSEVHRIVQEAVAKYLEQRREASSATLGRLREEAKRQILDALEAL